MEARLLDGRRALVTGASRGIGAETARAMARAGAAVALAARDKEALERVAEEIAAEGGRTLVLPTDVSDSAAVERMVAATVEGLGGLEVAVNNAAGGGRRAAGRSSTWPPPPAWRRWAARPATPRPSTASSG